MKKSKQYMWSNGPLITCPPVGLCLSEEAYLAETKRLNVPPEERNAWVSNERSHASTHFLRNDKYGKCIIVCMRGWEQKTLSQSIGLLVHEAVHIWRAEMEDIGEEKPSEEFSCYGIQSIAQGLVGCFFRITGKEKL